MIASLLHRGNSIELRSNHFKGEDTSRCAEFGARLRGGRWDRRLFWAFDNEEEGLFLKEITVLTL